MEKMMVDENTKLFKKSNYDFLDKATLQTWVREFLSRNKDFIGECKKFFKMDYIKAYQHHIELYKKYKIYFNFKPIVMRNEFSHSKEQVKMYKLPKLKIPELKTHIYLQPPVSAWRIFQRSVDPEIIQMNIKKQFEFRNKSDFITASCMNFSEGLNGTDDFEDIMEQFYGSCDAEGNYFCGDSLLISINLKYTKDVIKKEIDKILKLHKQRKPKSFRFDIWKYYLIAYDLRSEYFDLSYDKIATAMQNVYPKRKRTFDAKNCENYYKNALYLINGGYREYT